MLETARPPEEICVFFVVVVVVVVSDYLSENVATLFPSFSPASALCIRRILYLTYCYCDYFNRSGNVILLPWLPRLAFS